MARLPRGRYRPPAVQLANFEDFTGGLNLASGYVGLRPNESPRMRNIDILATGGITMRYPLTVLNSAALSGAHSMFQFESSNGTKQILLANATNTQFGTISFSSGTASVTMSTAFANTSTVACEAATFKDNLYVVRGTGGSDAPVRWTGSVATPLGTAFNDAFSNPTGGNMLPAAHIATHQGRVWIAGTRESGTLFLNRVRWSHPNQPEDFRTNDYIDVDTGADGDFIQAIVPFADRLYVFKRSSIYVITGYDQDTFQVYPVSRTLGACGPRAVCSSDRGIFFFNEETGVHLLTPSGGIEYLWEKLVPLIRQGRLTQANAGVIALGWFEGRVYCSVPLDAFTTNHTTFVCDLTIKGHPWMQHTSFARQFVTYNVAGQKDILLGLHPTSGFMLRFQDVSAPNGLGTDSFGSGVTTPYTYFYNTAWIDMGAPSERKRFRRPSFLVSTFQDYSTSFSYTVYKDYDPNANGMSSTLTAANQSFVAHGTLFDDEPLNIRDTILRGGTIGQARAVMFQLGIPTGYFQDRPVLYSMAVKFVRRRVR